MIKETAQKISELFADPDPVRFLDSEGNWDPSETAAEYLAELDGLSDSDYKDWYTAMVRARAFDTECTNLQRQGQLALWAPSLGQEGVQSGIAYAASKEDHIFPAYREHLVADVRGVDLLDITKQFRGITHGGWDVTDPKNGNFHLYTLVLGAQAQHAHGFALGQLLEAKLQQNDNTLEPEQAAIPTKGATLVFHGDGTTSEGDANEALVFAASYQVPLVFVVQNNRWAISVPVERQSRTPLYRRALGFGINSVQIDGNDPLAAFAVGTKFLRDARAGRGPGYIEALTYRLGAHTTSDDPTRYRADSELETWKEKDPIPRMQTFLKGRGIGEDFFKEAEEQAVKHARDVRERLLKLAKPEAENMFKNVYADPHPRTEEQSEWLARYEASFQKDQA